MAHVKTILLSDGTKAFGFPFRHNWQDSVIERLSYLTQIHRGTSGKEQRAGLRLNPRRALEYRNLVTDSARILFESLMMIAHSSWFALPIWMDARRINLTGQIDDEVITLSTEYLDFSPGAPVMFYFDEFDYELAEIESFDADSITLTAPLVGSWERVATVVPCRVSALEAKTNLVYLTGDVAQTTINWRLRPGAISANRLESASYTDYLDIPVYRPTHNWAETVDATQTIGRETLDFEVGQFTDDATETTAVSQIPVLQMLEGRQAIAQFLGFLDDRRGAQKAFWLYRPQAEIKPVLYTNNSNPAFNTLYFQDIGYIDHLFDLPNRRHLGIKRPDGVVFQRVEDALTVVDGDVMVLSPAVYIATPTAEVTASYLRYCRFDANEIEIAWQTSELANVATRFQELITIPT